MSLFSGERQRGEERVIAPETVRKNGVFGSLDVMDSSPLELVDSQQVVGEPVMAFISFGEVQGLHDGTVAGTNRSVPAGFASRRPQSITDLIGTANKRQQGASGWSLVRKDGPVVGLIRRWQEPRLYAWRAEITGDALRNGAVERGNHRLGVNTVAAATVGQKDFRETLC